MSPLAPAHDFLAARAVIGAFQVGIGITIMSRYILRIRDTTRLRRTGATLLGATMQISGMNEMLNTIYPLKNPYYIEIRQARMQAAINDIPQSSWFGPENFMPMRFTDYIEEWIALTDLRVAWEFFKASDPMVLFKRNLADYKSEVESKHIDNGTMGDRVIRILNEPVDPKAKALPADQVPKVDTKDALKHIFTALEVDIETSWEKITPLLKAVAIVNALPPKAIPRFLTKDYQGHNGKEHVRMNFDGISDETSNREKEGLAEDLAEEQNEIQK
ncbi:hypothetical protein CANARDRAFT_7303 [[Candida] arabinofermentans NRRL YB-2248]|uniref:Uncharacterized protein n=1 Tax=[Candida] arabinofermentans NRRL YB-2248 TaxID=983967 RepID=A0A1E4T2G3_9ASCO|nr:hypothetical protein CANARDRAFT_7303 [[Candida] arabinofermentans NRRL YB-2248]